MTEPEHPAAEPMALAFRVVLEPDFDAPSIESLVSHLRLVVIKIPRVSSKVRNVEDLIFASLGSLDETREFWTKIK
ncbi:MAG TPA: hypothetical protein VMM56_09490 [Planctomycetaceae bacterium]|nr:hypothetical protein [Planctomycetaceae bacterium]